VDAERAREARAVLLQGVRCINVWGRRSGGGLGVERGLELGGRQRASLGRGWGALYVSRGGGPADMHIEGALGGAPAGAEGAAETRSGARFVLSGGGGSGRWWQWRWWQWPRGGVIVATAISFLLLLPGLEVRSPSWRPGPPLALGGGGGGRGPGGSGAIGGGGPLRGGGRGMTFGKGIQGLVVAGPRVNGRDLAPIGVVLLLLVGTTW
jgi:hypothetical protein